MHFRVCMYYVFRKNKLCSMNDTAVYKICVCFRYRYKQELGFGTAAVLHKFSHKNWVNSLSFTTQEEQEPHLRSSDFLCIWSSPPRRGQPRRCIECAMSGLKKVIITGREQVQVLLQIYTTHYSQVMAEHLKDGHLSCRLGTCHQLHLPAVKVPFPWSPPNTAPPSSPCSWSSRPAPSRRQWQNSLVSSSVIGRSNLSDGCSS